MSENSDSIAIQKRKEHFEHLAEIATVLLANGMDKINDTENADRYEVIDEDNTIRTFTHHHLMRILDSNFDLACQKYSEWEVFLCLMPHISAEYHDFKDPLSYIKYKPLRYIEIIKTLANRKTFIGSCPACNES